jgi:hypothetical protein
MHATHPTISIYNTTQRYILEDQYFHQDLTMMTMCFSETSVCTHKSTQCYKQETNNFIGTLRQRQHASLKRWYLLIGPPALQPSTPSSTSSLQ